MGGASTAQGMMRALALCALFAAISFAELDIQDLEDNGLVNLDSEHAKPAVAQKNLSPAERDAAFTTSLNKQLAKDLKNSAAEKARIDQATKGKIVAANVAPAKAKPVKKPRRSMLDRVEAQDVAALKDELALWK